MGYKIITIIIGVYLMWLGSKMKSKNFSFPFLSGLFLVFYYTLILTKMLILLEILMMIY